MHPFSVLKVMILVHGLEGEERESMRREPSCVTARERPRGKVGDTSVHLQMQGGH